MEPWLCGFMGLKVEASEESKCARGGHWIFWRGIVGGM